MLLFLPHLLLLLDMLQLLLLLLQLLLLLAALLVRRRTPPAGLALVLLHPASAASAGPRPPAGTDLNHGAPAHDDVQLLGGERGLEVHVRVEGMVRSYHELARVLLGKKARGRGWRDGALVASAS